MEGSEKPKATTRPESPTTVKALDFDDDAVDQPTPLPTTTGTTASTVPIQSDATEENAPPKPPRPLPPGQQAEITLSEAFPTIDAAVIKAVLRASGGQVEPAFNALLGMSDPDAATEPVPPPQPPRKEPAALPATSTEDSQLAADERYARQLAEQYYNGADPYGNARRTRGGASQQFQGPPRRATGQVPERSVEDRERSFIDDDLPVIRDNIKKGFLETQQTVNKWVNVLKKKIDGEDDGYNGPQQSGPRYGSQGSYGGRNSGEFGRRSADRERYDADPQVLGDDFAHLHMQDSEAVPPRRSSRPLANPDLFKPTPARPQSQSSGRRVSFQDGPPEEINIHYPKSPSPLNPPVSGIKTSKWQPLAAVEPSPVADHDPFSLGDSDDEDSKKKDAKPGDNESLQKAAAEAMADDIGTGTAATLEPESAIEKDHKATNITAAK